MLSLCCLVPLNVIVFRCWIQHLSQFILLLDSFSIDSGGYVDVTCRWIADESLGQSTGCISNISRSCAIKKCSNGCIGAFFKNALVSKSRLLLVALSFPSWFSRSSPRQSLKDRRLSRSDSVPNLTTCHRSSVGQQSFMSPTHRSHTHHRSSLAKGRSPRHRASGSGRTHLHALLANRHGASFDETGPYLQHHKSSMDGTTEHCSKRDRNKRSDTAKRHVLARQKQVDNVEHQTKFNKSRRLATHSNEFLIIILPIDVHIHISICSNSTNSDISNLFRKGVKQPPTVSRTPSLDSRGVQTEDLLGVDKTLVSSPNRKRGILLAQTSTPSVDAKFR